MIQQEKFCGFVYLPWGNLLAVASRIKLSPHQRISGENLLEKLSNTCVSSWYCVNISRADTSDPIQIFISYIWGAQPRCPSWIPTVRAIPRSVLNLRILAKIFEYSFVITVSSLVSVLCSRPIQVLHCTAFGKFYGDWRLTTCPEPTNETTAPGWTSQKTQFVCLKKSLMFLDSPLHSR